MAFVHALCEHSDRPHLHDLKAWLPHVGTLYRESGDSNAGSNRNRQEVASSDDLLSNSLYFLVGRSANTGDATVDVICQASPLMLCSTRSQLASRAAGMQARGGEAFQAILHSMRNATMLTMAQRNYVEFIMGEAEHYDLHTVHAQVHEMLIERRHCELHAQAWSTRFTGKFAPPDVARRFPIRRQRRCSESSWTFASRSHKARSVVGGQLPCTRVVLVDGKHRERARVRMPLLQDPRSINPLSLATPQQVSWSPSPYM
uniref:Uncharacterized protein n=1 Tax=Haptolina ericina TaxID=156174 RepID=A0A7S3AZC1_9EUKA